jgi:hypothetical protein
MEVCVGLSSGHLSGTEAPGYAYIIGLVHSLRVVVPRWLIK